MPHELCSAYQPLGVVLAENDALRWSRVEAAVEVIDLLAKTPQRVAAVVLEQGHGGQAKLLGDVIAPLATPEALLLGIGDIEQQKEIGEMGIGHRMACGAPLTKQNQFLVLRLL